MKEYFIWLAKLITVLVLVFVIVIVIIGGMAGMAKMAMTDRDPQVERGIAVVEVTGIIDNSKEIVEQLYKQAANDRVKGIVLRVNSPGGAVAPSQDIYSAVRELKHRKPIVASFDSVAASGGLYVALGASKIYAQPSTMTGSIGVIVQIPNVRTLAHWAGFDMVTVKSGRLKDVGNIFREMTEEERIFLQETIDVVHEDFIRAIMEGRNMAREDVLPFADGRVLLGSHARSLGLVDEFGGVYDAGREVYALLGEPLDEDQIPNLFYPTDKFGQLRRILGSASSFMSILTNRRMEFRYEMN